MFRVLTTAEARALARQEACARAAHEAQRALARELRETGVAGDCHEQSWGDAAQHVRHAGLAATRVVLDGGGGDEARRAWVESLEGERWFWQRNAIEAARLGPRLTLRDEAPTALEHARFALFAAVVRATATAFDAASPPLRPEDHERPDMTARTDDETRGEKR